MASSGRVTVTAEDIAGSDDTLKGALSVWILKHGVVDYNKFQSVYFSLKRDHHYEDPDEVQGENQSDRQRRMMALYQQVNAEAWGSDWACLLYTSPSPRDRG